MALSRDGRDEGTATHSSHGLAERLDGWTTELNRTNSGDPA